MGKLFDEAGGRLTPTHAIKQGQRYRYYVSSDLVTGTRKTKKAETGWLGRQDSTLGMAESKSAIHGSAGDSLGPNLPRPARKLSRCFPGASPRNLDGRDLSATVS